MTLITSKKKNGFVFQTLSNQIESCSSLLEISEDDRKRPEYSKHQFPVFSLCLLEILEELGTLEDSCLFSVNL